MRFDCIIDSDNPTDILLTLQGKDLHLDCSLTMSSHCKTIVSGLFRGQMPADAEYKYLEHAKRLDMYGAFMYPAQLKVMITL